MIYPKYIQSPVSGAPFALTPLTRTAGEPRQAPPKTGNGKAAGYLIVTPEFKFKIGVYPIFRNRDSVAFAFSLFVRLYWLGYGIRFPNSHQ
jgi:hypothetical protein